MRATNSSWSFSLSWQLLKSCFKFLGSNKDLLFFPIIAFIFVIGLAILSIVSWSELAGLFQASSQTAFNQWAADSPILFGALLYFCASFLIIFFNAALITCVSERLQQRPCSIINGITTTCKRVSSILLWSLISCSIGLILQILQNSHRLFQRLIAMILGTTWSIASYFVIPFIVNADISAIAALSKSLSLFKGHWRRMGSVYLLMTLIFMAIIATIYGIFHLVPVVPQIHLIIIGLGALMIITMIIVSNTFDAILKSALYLAFVEQKDPSCFTKDQLNASLIKTNS